MFVETTILITAAHSIQDLKSIFLITLKFLSQLKQVVSCPLSYNNVMWLFSRFGPFRGQIQVSSFTRKFKESSIFVVLSLLLLSTWWTKNTGWDVFVQFRSKCFFQGHNDRDYLVDKKVHLVVKKMWSKSMFVTFIKVTLSAL